MCSSLSHPHIRGSSSRRPPQSSTTRASKFLSPLMKNLPRHGSHHRSPQNGFSILQFRANSGRLASQLNLSAPKLNRNAPITVPPKKFKPLLETFRSTISDMLITTNHAKSKMEVKRGSTYGDEAEEDSQECQWSRHYRKFPVVAC